MQAPATTTKKADISSIRAEFPIFRQTINGNPLTYLDSAATAQKPQCVIDAISKLYEEDYGSVKRGMHELAERSTEIYEAARERVRSFVNAKSAHEVIFVKNTTEGINLVARSWGESSLKKGDVVLLSILEHHSNIVPWMQLKDKIGIEIEWVGIDGNGMLDMEELKNKLAEKSPKLVSMTCVSNVLGTVTPYEEITKLAHESGAKVLLDAAQLAPHRQIDVQRIDCDFLVFSGHKVYGPTGIGVLYGKEKLLNAMPPFLGGGSMIQEVTTEGFKSTHLPDKFEAGTPPIAEAYGLHVALDWIESVGWDDIQRHEEELMTYAVDRLSRMSFVEMIGIRNSEFGIRTGCISFLTPPIHPHDLTEYLGHKGVCLRAGHHCAQPLHDHLGHPATTRMSLAVYNTEEDIDRMCEVIQEGYEFFAGKTL